MNDWRVYVEPHGRLSPALERLLPPGGRMTLEIVYGDRLDAQEALDAWAEAIHNHGFIPEAMDVRSRPGAAVLRPRSVDGLSVKIRCDTFEQETESGTTSGIGYIRAEEVPPT